VSSHFNNPVLENKKKNVYFEKIKITHLSNLEMIYSLNNTLLGQLKTLLLQCTELISLNIIFSLNGLYLPLAVLAEPHSIQYATANKLLILNTLYFQTVINTPKNNLQKVCNADKAISKRSTLSA